MRKNETIYWCNLEQANWSICLAATEAGLCYVSLRANAFDHLKAWADARFRGSALFENPSMLKPYSEQLEQYMQGQLTSFTFPLSLHGTPFQTEVWEALRTIDYGHTCSYSHIAHLIGRPQAVRAVGAAIGANPILIAIPCHRVIGKQGALTGYRDGMEIKKKLLQLEQAAKTDL